MSGENLLIEKALSGDTKAFEQLIQPIYPRIYAICFRTMQNEQDALDVCQNVLIKIFRSLSSYKNQSAFTTWVYRICVNMAIDELRKMKRHHVIPMERVVETDDGEMQIEIVSDELTPDEQFIRKERAEIVRASISKLKEDHQMVIILRDLEGMSYEEISEVTNSSLGTVKSRINRARQALKEILLHQGNFFE